MIRHKAHPEAVYSFVTQACRRCVTGCCCCRCGPAAAAVARWRALLRCMAATVCGAVPGDNSFRRSPCNVTPLDVMLPNQKQLSLQTHSLNCKCISRRTIFSKVLCVVQEGGYSSARVAGGRGAGAACPRRRVSVEEAERRCSGDGWQACFLPVFDAQLMLAGAVEAVCVSSSLLSLVASDQAGSLQRICDELVFATSDYAVSIGHPVKQSGSRRGCPWTLAPGRPQTAASCSPQRWGEILGRTPRRARAATAAPAAALPAAPVAAARRRPRSCTCRLSTCRWESLLLCWVLIVTDMMCFH